MGLLRRARPDTGLLDLVDEAGRNVQRASLRKFGHTRAFESTR